MASGTNAEYAQSPTNGRYATSDATTRHEWRDAYVGQRPPYRRHGHVLIQEQSSRRGRFGQIHERS